MPEHQAESATPAATVIPAAVRESVEEAPANDEALARIRSHGMFAQRKLQLGAADDPLEDEADRVAEHVMRMPAGPIVQRACEACDDEREAISRKPWHAAMRKCSACDEEERTGARPAMSFVQRQSSSDGGSLSDDDAGRIAATRGSGAPLPSETRTFMEQRFDADFSGVNVHAGSSASELASDLDAQAFTVGQDIYFNDGQYAPSTSDGRRLLAHELVHVVQQTPDVRAKKPAATPACAVARGPAVQRKYFAPKDFKVRGDFVHLRVLPLFVDHLNPDLFIEVRVPGSDKDFVDPANTGIADLYKAQPQRTIGLRFPDEPAFLTKSGRLRFGGGPYDHNRLSAPQGGKHKPRARRMDFAPQTIELGDLKPGGGAEAILGSRQLENYARGIGRTATDLSAFLAADPQQSDGTTSWSPKVTTIASLAIPDRLVYPTGPGIAMERLAVWESGHKVSDDSGLQGAMYVYQDPQPGIWSYEWIPDDIPTTTGSRAVNDVLNRLNNDVIPPLISAGATGVAPKRLAHPVSTVPARRRVVQRKDEKFDDANWKKKHYGPWKEDADKVLGDKGEMQKASVAEALVDLKGRVAKVNVPVDVQEAGRGVGKIKYWTRLGGLFGWLREKFDFIFVKVHAFARWVKDKVQKLVQRVSGSSFGSWLKAAAQVVFKIFKLVGAWVVGEVLDKLVNSLRSGIMNNIRKVIDMITPEGVKAKIEEFEELKERYRAIIEEKEDELVKRFFGDKLEFFESLRKYEEIADTFSTIVSIIEWGVRLLACASPPAIGCLWNLAMSALQWAFAKLMQTCWFTKKVYEPVIERIDIVRNFPTEIAAKIVDTANEYIPVPAGFDHIFATIHVDTATFRFDCNEGGDGADSLTPERKAILDLVGEMGPDKFNAMLELSLKRGAGPWVLMTAERITAMKDVLSGLSADEIRTVAEDKSKGAPQSLDNFLKSIQAYTPAEKKLIERAAEERKKAAEAKELAEGGKGGAGAGGPGAGGGAGGAGGGGKGTAPSYEIIRGPTGLDESQAKHVSAGVEELTLSIKQQDAHRGVSCDAKLVLNDEGTIVTIPVVKIRIDGKTQILTSGELPPPVYYISFTEDISIKYSNGQVKKLTSIQLSERFIKFSSI